MYRIPLRVTGVDLDDDATLATLCEFFDDMTWMDIDGRTVTVIHSVGDPIGPTIQAARQITATIPGAKVVEVDQDLVGISDIAKRVGVSREAVRLWAEGKRGPGEFPSPVGSSGSGERGSIRLWQWASVSEWLRQYGLHDDQDALSPAQIMEVNAALHRVLSPMDHAWQEVSKRPMHVSQLRTASANIESVDTGHTVLTIYYSAATAWHERLAAAQALGDAHERDGRPAFH